MTAPKTAGEMAKDAAIDEPNEHQACNCQVDAPGEHPVGLALKLKRGLWLGLAVAGAIGRSIDGKKSLFLVRHRKNFGSFILIKPNRQCSSKRMEKYISSRQIYSLRLSMLLVRGRELAYVLYIFDY